MNNPSHHASGYTTGSIGKHVFKLSSVMIVGFFAMTMGGLIEIFYIGQVGNLELAAYTFVFPIAMSLNALTRGIGVGSSSLVAQRVGAGRETSAVLAGSHGLLLVTLVSILAALVGYLTAEPLFSRLGATGEVLTMVLDYFDIWLLGLPLMGIVMVASGLVRSFGDPTFPGYIMSSGPLVQVALGPFLIFGWLGLPAMGLAGAAWIFVLSSAVQVLLVLYWFVIRYSRLTSSLRGFSDTTFSVLQVGIPASATNLIPPLSMVLITYLLAKFGATIVAAFGVAARIESVASMVVVGISQAVIPMVGQNWGAGNIDRVQQTMRTCWQLCHLWGVTAAIIMAVFATWFISIVNDDPPLVEAAVMYLYILPVTIGFMGMFVVSNATFNAIRKPVPALVLSIARMIVLFLPLAILLGDIMGYIGIFYAAAVSNIIVGFASWIWCKRIVHQQFYMRFSVAGR